MRRVGADHAYPVSGDKSPAELEWHVTTAVQAAVVCEYALEIPCDVGLNVQPLDFAVSRQEEGVL